MYSQRSQSPRLLFFFFNHTATPEIYTLSLHDALPICGGSLYVSWVPGFRPAGLARDDSRAYAAPMRSEEHTSELQSRFDLVCRLLLEKKKQMRCCFSRCFCTR